MKKKLLLMLATALVFGNSITAESSPVEDLFNIISKGEVLLKKDYYKHKDAFYDSLKDVVEKHKEYFDALMNEAKEEKDCDPKVKNFLAEYKAWRNNTTTEDDFHQKHSYILSCIEVAKRPRREQLIKEIEGFMLKQPFFMFLDNSPFSSDEDVSDSRLEGPIRFFVDVMIEGNLENFRNEKMG